jgi:hypothetical protein
LKIRSEDPAKWRQREVSVAAGGTAQSRIDGGMNSK